MDGAGEDGGGGGRGDRKVVCNIQQLGVEKTSEC